MEFGEKLLVLRKKEGLSQEALAEKLNTSRQAVSKWENGQGFPETEKILIISNIFDVSIDYLLKNSFIGLGIIIYSYIPYIIFKESFQTYVIIISLMIAIGVGLIIRGTTFEDNYKVIKREVLVFDEKVIRDLKDNYNSIKNKYSILSGIGICLMVCGMVILFFLNKGFELGVDTTLYQIACTFLIALGVSIAGYFMSMNESYKVLVKNEDYTNGFEFRIMEKVKKWGL
ncbi:MAG: helix-turn-helix domain-containing protein [Peptostreptococcaceae bacterium]